MDTRLCLAARSVLESLESRRLLASISGTVIEDLDYDSVRDGREQPLAGLTVYLDQNQNRQLDSGEVSTTSDANGFYEFSGLDPGDYFVTLIVPPNYAVAAPGSNGRLVDEYDIE